MDRAHLGTETQTIAVDSVIEQLDAKRITGEYQPAQSNVPNCQAKHAIDVVQHLIAPLFVSVQDYLSVGISAKHMAIALQLTLKLLEVIDLAVENHPYRLFLVRHRLVTARKIDDREPTKPESERSVNVVTLVVRPSMGDGLCHRLNFPAPNGCRVPIVILSANSAHKNL